MKSLQVNYQLKSDRASTHKESLEIALNCDNCKAWGLNQ